MDFLPEYTFMLKDKKLSIAKIKRKTEIYEKNKMKNARRSDLS